MSRVASKEREVEIRGRQVAEFHQGGPLWPDSAGERGWRKGEWVAGMGELKPGYGRRRAQYKREGKR